MKRGYALATEDSKGLDFDDLLIFNFIASLPGPCVWDALFSQMTSHCPQHAVALRAILFSIARLEHPPV